MKRAFTSVSAAAIALSIIGSVAAAPAPAPKPASKPTPKPTPAAGKAVKKDSKPKLSKWQMHVQEMLKVSAPGDEYFGRMKMSYLGINNTFRDDLIRAGAYTTDPKLLSQINWADEALLAWAKRYPNDPQLARSYFLAFQMYRKVWTREYQDKAWDYAHIVVAKWPNSFFGKALTKDLSIGFTEHYFADASPCPVLTALPSGAPQPTASPSPIPTATPTTAPGRPKAEVLPVPCFTPVPSPVPTTTPATSGSPLPGATGSPLPGASVSPLPGATGSPLPGATGSPLPIPSGSLTPSPAPTPTHKP